MPKTVSIHKFISRGFSTDWHNLFVVPNQEKMNGTLPSPCLPQPHKAKGEENTTPKNQEIGPSNTHCIYI